MDQQLPPPVKAYLLSVSREQGALAFLVLRPDGHLEAKGGELAHHNLEHLAGLQVGASAREPLPFLVGLLGDLDQPIILPHLQVEGGPPVTIHLIPHEEKVWCLFQDQGSAFRDQRDLQQAMYDTILRGDQAQRLPLGLLHRFGLVALEYRGRNRFRALGELPAWAAGVLPSPGEDGSLDLEPGPSFLECFVAEAIEQWEDREAPPLSSGTYEDGPSPDAVVALELHAVRVDGRRFLVLEKLGEDHTEHQGLLQAARERSLAHRELGLELARKEVLVHCVVHDLANPASSLKLALGLLEKKVPEDSRRILGMAQDAVEQQLALIQDILEAFRADKSQAAAVDPAGVSPAAAAQGAVEQVALDFQSRAVTLEVDVPEDTPRARGEGRRVRRMLVNFLENARRHSPRGGLRPRLGRPDRRRVPGVPRRRRGRGGPRGSSGGPLPAAPAGGRQAGQGRPRALLLSNHGPGMGGGGGLRRLAPGRRSLLVPAPSPPPRGRRVTPQTVTARHTATGQDRPQALQTDLA